MIRRKSHIAKAEALGERQVRVICSTPDVDRMGDVVVQDGIDLSAYIENPIVLWQHDPAHPIGRASNIGLRGGVLTADVDFAPAGISATADEVCGLTKAGVINTVSIGFQPIESAPMDPSKPRGAQRFVKSELMEFSFVSIPANTGAAVIARQVTQPPASTATTVPVNRKTLAGFMARIQRKDLCDVGCLAWILQSLGCAVDCAAWEAAMEGDGSQVPQMLVDAMQAVANALLAMTQEEVAEALADAQANATGQMGGNDDDMMMMMSGAAPVTKALGLAAWLGRAGHVLSASNETDMRTARAKIDGVLGQVRSIGTTNDNTAEKSDAAMRHRMAEALALAVA